MKILFICKGNVGRSQMAEALFRKKFGDEHEVASAGTTLSGPEEPISKIPLAYNVIDCMEEEGVDVSNSFRKQLTESMLNDADTVIFMSDAFDPIPEYLVNNKKVISWNVDNPKGMDLAGHKRVKDEIKSLIETLF